MEEILKKLEEVLPGKVKIDLPTREKYKRDASVFEITPQAVVYPENVTDIKSIVNFIREHKGEDKELSVSVRAAGTCMSGGSLTDSILIVVEKLNHITELTPEKAVVEPGVYFRNLERELNKLGVLYPPYPSSKRLCAVGGIAANNSGGEKSLSYGKAEDFITELKVILRDGNEYTFSRITRDELQHKLKLETFEGEIYRKVFELVEKNHGLLAETKIHVSKNSSGYNLWRVWDKEYFDLTKLFVGSQGTLGIITEITFKLVPKKKHRGLLVAYMNNYDNLPDIVKTVLAHKPDCFETFDHYTLRLALKYFYAFPKILHMHMLDTIKAFVPEFINVARNGMPKLVLLVEFEGDEIHDIHTKLNTLNAELQKYTNLYTKITHNERERNKYWAIRRESFNLLRKRVVNKYAAPFIDDTCVATENLPEFLPLVYQILDESDLQYTIAGHIGNGNFHIIPLMDMTKQTERDKIYAVSDKIFALVEKYKGTTSGEHNDGLIRSPYLKELYGDHIYELFREVKKIFDPYKIFNPHKKVDVTKEYAEQFLIGSTKDVKAILDYQ